MAAYLFFGLVAFITAGWLWFFIVRPILEDWHVGPALANLFNSAPGRVVADWRAVKHSQPPRRRTYHVMSRQSVAVSRQTVQTKQTDRVFAPDPRIANLRVDRTRTALIELLVYSGWKTGEIRSVLKGDTGAIGIEVEAARQRLGIEAEPPRMIVVNNDRRIPFRETDPELAYDPPA